MGLGDRFVFGFIALMLGSLVGGFSALLVTYAVEHSAFKLPIVYFVGSYSFLTGFVCGARVGDFLGAAVAALGAIALAMGGVVPANADVPASTGLWWLLGLIGGIVLLAFFA